MDVMNIEVLFVFALISFAAAMVHGSIGFGFPMVATPLLALITDIHTAIVVRLPHRDLSAVQKTGGHTVIGLDPLCRLHWIGCGFVAKGMDLFFPQFLLGAVG